MSEYDEDRYETTHEYKTLNRSRPWVDWLIILLFVLFFVALGFCIGRYTK